MAAANSDKPQVSAPTPIPEPVSFTRELSGTFNGESVNYRAVAGETYVRDEKGAPVASFFTTAYLKTGVEDPSRRPVMFLFNGGPGSSSQWLHMGAFGPRRVVVPTEPDNAGAPPYDIVDNPVSILDCADLVFIDPVGTGYSRALGEKDPKEFWGLLEDARSIADFIRTWLDVHKRWNSPKYLGGESYGTTRASLVAEILSKHYVALNGIVLISAVLDFQNSRPQPEDGGILSYAAFLPTYAAIAWYHGKVERKGRTFEAFLDEVRTFACREYAYALIANNRLGRNERKELIARTASYTGLKESYIEQSKLRIPVSRFFKELLRDEGRVIGRLDGRYTGIEPENAGESFESDPSMDAVGNAFTSAINTHFSELGVKMDRPYLPMHRPHQLMKFIEEWNWVLEEKVTPGGRYVNVVPYLGRAMRHNKDLRVLVASGYYDLATPFLGAENALSQDGVVAGRITYTYYEVGHMLFLHEPSRLRFLHDVRQFMGGQRAGTDR